MAVQSTDDLTCLTTRNAAEDAEPYTSACLTQAHTAPHSMSAFAMCCRVQIVSSTKYRMHGNVEETIIRTEELTTAEMMRR